MSVVESAREQLLSSGMWSVEPAHSTIEFRAKHALALRGQLDRSDDGLTWKRLLESGNVLVSDVMQLLLDVAAVRV